MMKRFRSSISDLLEALELPQRCEHAASSVLERPHLRKASRLANPEYRPWTAHRDSGTKLVTTLQTTHGAARQPRARRFSSHDKAVEHRHDDDSRPLAIGSRGHVQNLASEKEAVRTIARMYYNTSTQKRKTPL
jgi:hypothetical protein